MTEGLDRINRLIDAQADLLKATDEWRAEGAPDPRPENNSGTPTWNAVQTAAGEVLRILREEFPFGDYAPDVAQAIRAHFNDDGNTLDPGYLASLYHNEVITVVVLRKALTKKPLVPIWQQTPGWDEFTKAFRPYATPL